MDKYYAFMLGALSALSVLILPEFVLRIWKNKSRKYIKSHFWLHPNAISVWRTLIGFLSTGLYFGTDYKSAAINLFAISAALDKTDGTIADHCDLHTESGKELDPFCDKLVYLPPLVGFAILGHMSIYPTILLVGIEFLGQILRRLMSSEGYLMGATNYGKIKATLCFVLVIYCAIMDTSGVMAEYGNTLMIGCIILSVISIISKMPLKKIINGS